MSFGLPGRTSTETLPTPTPSTYHAKNPTPPARGMCLLLACSLVGLDGSEDQVPLHGTPSKSEITGQTIVQCFRERLRSPPPNTGGSRNALPPERPPTSEAHASPHHFRSLELKLHFLQLTIATKRPWLLHALVNTKQACARTSDSDRNRPNPLRLPRIPMLRGYEPVPFNSGVFFWMNVNSTEKLPKYAASASNISKQETGGTAHIQVSSSSLYPRALRQAVVLWQQAHPEQAHAAET